MQGYFLLLQYSTAPQPYEVDRNVISVDHGEHMSLSAAILRRRVAALRADASNAA